MTEEDNSLNPLHPIISVNILYTVLCTLCYVLTRRIRLTIKSSFLMGAHFPFVLFFLIDFNIYLVGFCPSFVFHT